jgi:NADH:ubiquinone oxidoreductase subunit 4 (subunit M)
VAITKTSSVAIFILAALILILGVYPQLLIGMLP